MTPALGRGRLSFLFLFQSLSTDELPERKLQKWFLPPPKTYSMLHTVCYILYATYSMLHTVCYILYATLWMTRVLMRESYTVDYKNACSRYNDLTLCEVCIFF